MTDRLYLHTPEVQPHMPKTLKPEIVGLQEIADLLEVDKRTPHAWMYRRLLPEPDFDSINGLRAWRRTTIVRWAASTGRLPESGSLGDEVPRSIKVPPYRGSRGRKKATVEA